MRVLISSFLVAILLLSSFFLVSLASPFISDRYTNQSKGFGFVEMADADAATAAISALNGTNLDGRTIKVNIAEDKPRDSLPRSNNDRY